MTADAFRKIALTLAGATEHSHMQHPDFRVNGRVFATLGYPDSDWGMVKLTPEQQHNFVGAEPSTFVPVKGAWGLKGCTSVRLKGAHPVSLRRAIIAAHAQASSLSPTRTARKSAK